MPSPVFNESTIKNASSWAAPDPNAAGYAAPQPGTGTTDGPISSWKSGVMTVRGTLSATAVLFALFLTTATFGWFAAEGPTLDNGVETYQFPALAMVGIFVGLACVFGLWFRPQWAKYIAPIYALAQGFAVGAISRGYETFYDGIVLQAAGATAAVFFVMLTLYRTRIIKVTERFRRTIIVATLGVMVLYGVSFLMSLFGATPTFLNSPSALGIGLSVLIAGIAAFNLMLDFDFIERGSQQGLSKDFEWYAAFGLLVTIVWLYLEMLRLISKLRE